MSSQENPVRQSEVTAFTRTASRRTSTVSSQGAPCADLQEQRREGYDASHSASGAAYARDMLNSWTDSDVVPSTGHGIARACRIHGLQCSCSERKSAVTDGEEAAARTIDFEAASCAVSLPICASLILPVSGTKSSISNEWSEFPQRTHRIWNGGQAPDRLPQSFGAELTPFSRCGMPKLLTFHKRGAHIGSLTVMWCWDSADDPLSGTLCRLSTLFIQILD